MFGFGFKWPTEIFINMLTMELLHNTAAAAVTVLLVRTRIENRFKCWWMCWRRMNVRALHILPAVSLFSLSWRSLEKSNIAIEMKSKEKREMLFHFRIMNWSVGALVVTAALSTKCFWRMSYHYFLCCCCCCTVQSPINEIFIFSKIYTDRVVHMPCSQRCSSVAEELENILSYSISTQSYRETCSTV